MFGANEALKQTLDPEGRLFVQEIFYTIQGEGPLAGMPAVFIRLAGCNLRCYFCDTEFSSGMLNPIMSVKEIIESVYSCSPANCELVVLTGGEPLRQNIYPLVKELQLLLMKVQIETAGTLWVPGLDALAPTLVCSPKTSKIHLEVENNCSDYKYIIGHDDLFDPDDGLPITSTQAIKHKAMNDTPMLMEVKIPKDGRQTKLYRPVSNMDVIWVQPRDDSGLLFYAEEGRESNRKNLELAKQLALKHGYRLSLQQHKLLGLP